MSVEQLKYTKEHEWIRVEGEIATMGITDYAQGELGDVVFVELPGVGTKINRCNHLGPLRRSRPWRIFSPLSLVK